MCLIVCAWRSNRNFPLVVAANRDEFYDRPTAPLASWDDRPGILAGRDLQAGGTWLGATRSGRFAAVTNYRTGGGHEARPKSRGWLVSSFLDGDATPFDYAYRVAGNAASYAPFNLLVADQAELVYVAGVTGEVIRLEHGVYGLSNHLLDTPWPKLRKATSALTEQLDRLAAPEDLLALLLDHDPAPPGTLPRTGISPEWERILSPIFIQSETYGTRSSTVLLMDATNVLSMLEVRYGAHGETGRTLLRLDME